MGASVAALILVGAVTLGLAGPAVSLVPGLPATASIDRPLSARSFTPLSEEYIADALGRTAPRSDRGSGVGSLLVDGPASTPRTIVDHGFTNDDVEDALTVSSIPFTARTQTSGASREQGEPDDCIPSGGTIWYRYETPDASRLIASTVGTDRAMTLGVYRGEPGDLHLMRCDTDLNGNAQAAFRPEAGDVLYFQLSAPASGSVVFNLDPFGDIQRASVSTDGTEGDDVSQVMDISADGRFVVFTSWATTLVEGDTNGVADVFLRDLETGTTERVSIAGDGAEGNAASGIPAAAVSDDGRYVAFRSYASNLVPDDTNGWADVFVRDRVRGRTERVSVHSNGSQGTAPRDAFAVGFEAGCGATGHECYPTGGLSITGDGRFVAFDSVLSGLVDDDDTEDLLPGYMGADVFVHDRAAGRTELVSLTTDGVDGDGVSQWASISADGRFIAFSSKAQNLLGGGQNAVVGTAMNAATPYQVFLRDRQRGTTRLVSHVEGAPAQGDSSQPRIADDGGAIVFISTAADLVPADANGIDDVFVYQIATDEITRVSVNSDGQEQRIGNTAAFPTGAHVDPASASISADGRFVAFSSGASNLDDTDSDAPVGLVGLDVFLHDRATATTVKVTVATEGGVSEEEDTAASASFYPFISGDGSRIAFDSFDSTLVEGDDNSFPDERAPLVRGADVFVHTFPGLR